ncbi:MAG TPA: lysophospholipid acyltransferase family protein [Chthoniobacteraceae bacterium]|jgi:1-acyl-sn-glycerol-3-phosphate acyltransferase
MLEDWKYEPAHDLGLLPRQRARSLQRESGLLSTTVNSCWRLATRGYLAAYHRLQVDGLHHLPLQPPFVLVANHSSHLDAIILAASLPCRHVGCVYPIAAGDTFFEQPLLATFASSCLNALPIWRKRSCAHSLEELRDRLLQEGCIFIIFPEGTRSRTGEMGAFKPGFGRLVCGTDVPVVPCHIAGAWSAFPPGKTLPRPRPIRLRIGSPIYFPRYDNSREGWTEAAHEAEAAVRSLRPPA